MSAAASTMSAAEIGARLQETVWKIQSIPEPTALSVFAVVLIALGLAMRFRRRDGAVRVMRDAAQNARRRVTAAFTFARKRLKNGASEGT
jgi:hypothetical protein